MSEEIRSAVLELADKYLFPYEVKQKPHGDELVPEFCPFCQGGSHQRDKKTFAISLENGCFVCKRGSCGKRGNFDALAEFFHENIRLNHKHAELSVNRSKTYTLPTVKMLPPTETIYQYFENRKISRETVDAFKIGADDKGNIVFPFFENGENVFVKFRKPQKHRPEDKFPKEWRESGTKPILFGMDDCVFSQPLVITEGMLDTMSLFEAGIRNVVSVPSGCEDFSWVETCYDWLEKFKTIILFGDNDEPGQKMVKAVAKRLDESRCKVVESYPCRPNGQPCKDANEILYFCGEFALIDAVENANDIPVKGLLNLGDVVPTDPTLIPRIKTNIPKLDAMTGGLLEGGITIVLGKAGSGKSVLSNMIALNAIEQGYTVCVYTGEFRADRFQYWINLQAAGSDYIGLKYDPVKDKKVPVLPYAVQERVMQWYSGKLLLYDNDEVFDGSQGDAILNVFTMAVRRHGAKLLICDNLMTMCADQEDEWRAQAIFANKLKKFANRYGVAVLLVAHARKTKAGEKLNADDLSGASATNNLADVTMSVQQGSITILKNRDTGTLGTIEFCYCPDSRRLYQADAGDRMNLSWDHTGITPPSPLANSLPEYQVVPPIPAQPF